MTTPNLQELATQIHEANKAAGWWDTPRPRVQTAWLVVTELAEATEAERAERYADLETFESLLVDNEKVIEFSIEIAGSPTEENIEKHRLLMWAGAFKTHIKDTFEDEIADATIRLLDFAASEDYAKYMMIEPSFRSNKGVTNEEAFFSVTSCLWQLIGHLDQEEEYASVPYMYGTLSMLVELANLRSFDLWHHVDLKLKYNATRGKMHGGKKF